MKTPALPDWVKTDVSFSLSVGQFRKCAYHIRAVLDDNMVVMCHWVKSRQRWEYEVMDVWFFDVRKDHIDNIRPTMASARFRKENI